MKKLKISVLGITQAGKTTAIIHLAKNYNNLRCLCCDEDKGRTKISVRYYIGGNITKDEFKLVKINDDETMSTKEIESVEQFASIINNDDVIKQYDYAEVYLIPNDIICKMMIDKEYEQIILYDTRGLMDLVTETIDEKNEIKITNLTKVGIDKPDAVLFFYAKEGSSNIKSLYTKLIEETFSSAPFFVFIRAEENDKKKYNNLIRGIFNFFKSLYIKLNFSIKINEVEVKADFELENKIDANLSGEIEINKGNKNNEIIPYYNSENDIIYRLSEYDLNTLEDEDKYIKEINNYFENIVSKIILYNKEIEGKRLREFFDNNVIKEKILKVAMADIKKYKGETIRNTLYCYPEKYQGTNYDGLIQHYKSDELLGPQGGISTRDGQLRYFYTIVMFTLIHNVLYEIINNGSNDDEFKALLRTSLARTNDSYYCSSFLFNRYVIKKSIEEYRSLNINDAEQLFKIVIHNTLIEIRNVFD